jgi:hypothetical protein
MSSYSALTSAQETSTFFQVTNFKSSFIRMEAGGLSMKVDYSKMSWQELRAYCLANREDLDALEAFFARRSPDSEAVIFHPPRNEEEWAQQMEMMRPILERQRPTSSSPQE